MGEKRIGKERLSPYVRPACTEIADKRDRDELLRNILDLALNLMKAPHGSIRLYDPDTDTLVVTHGAGIDQYFVGERRVRGQGLSGRAWESGNIEMIADYRCWEGRMTHPGLDVVGTVLAIPLKTSNAVMGVINISYEEQDHQVPRRDLEELCRFSDLAAMILQQANACEALKQERNERKLASREFAHYMARDSLTGLMNRNSFERELQLMEEHPMDAGAIMCDIDGLKLINSTLGSEAGDAVIVKMGEMLRKVFRSADIVARIGGDEFCILLFQVPQKTVEDGVRRIRQAMDEFKTDITGIAISLSVGWAWGNTDTKELRRLCEEADGSMCREKLLNNRSIRNNIMKTAMSLLWAKDATTEQHAVGVETWIVRLADELHCSESMRSDLRLLAKFHDIGKVGVPDAILKKQAALTLEERREIERHCEIGRRIAEDSVELSRISDYILKHHEWWNGQGYPLRIRGVDIPLPCRMMAVADAFDAMTSDRPYRRALDMQTAVRELERCSGEQFDPEIVAVFVGQVLNNYAIGEGGERHCSLSTH